MSSSLPPIPENWNLTEQQKTRWIAIEEKALANHEQLPNLFPPGYTYGSNYQRNSDVNLRLYQLENETDENKKSRINQENEKSKQIEEDNNQVQNQMNQIKNNAAKSPPEYPIYIYISDVYLTNRQKNMKTYDSKSNKFYFYEGYYLKDSNDNFIFANSLQNAIIQVKNQLATPNSNLQESYDEDRGTNIYKLRISSNNTNSKFVEKKIYPVNQPFNCWQVFVTNAKPSRLSNFRMSFRKIGKGGKTNNKKSNRKMKSIKRKPKNIKKKTTRRK